MRLVAFPIALALAASAFGQQKSDVVPRDTGSDLLWKKLESRVEEIAARLDGVMGVAILDLTDGRILLHNADRVFPAASSIKSRSCWNYIVRIRKLAREPKGKQSWMTFVPSIPKTWSKTAGLWLVLPLV